MKKRIALLESDGYYHPGNDESQCWCRREKVAGRLELLTAFFDGPPFWFVRLRNRSDADAIYLKDSIGLQWFGNGHWRFVDRDLAEKKFAELACLPKYVQEAQKAEELRQKRADMVRARVLEGKMRLRPPTG